MKSFREELNLQDYMSDKEDIFFFINSMLKLKKQPRGDYTEFLDLAKVILGETVERNNGYEFQIQRIRDHEQTIMPDGWQSPSI